MQCGDLTTAHECPKCGIRVPEKSEESISKDDNKLDKMYDDIIIIMNMIILIIS